MCVYVYVCVCVCVIQDKEWEVDSYLPGGTLAPLFFCQHHACVTVSGVCELWCVEVNSYLPEGTVAPLFLCQPHAHVCGVCDAGGLTAICPEVQ